MTNDSIGTTGFQPDAAAEEHLFDSWFDPIEHAVRERVRSFIEKLIEGELEAILARPRYGRRAQDGGGAANSGGVAGHRHGSRTRMLTGTFGRTEIAVPRARLMQLSGGTTEWKSQALRAYQRRTRAAEALIASAYLAGVDTRRVRRVADGAVWRRCGQGYGEPDLAQGEGRLGCLECPFARRRADRAAHSRRHPGADRRCCTEPASSIAFSTIWSKCMRWLAIP